MANEYLQKKSLIFYRIWFGLIAFIFGASTILNLIKNWNFYTIFVLLIGVSILYFLNKKIPSIQLAKIINFYIIALVISVFIGWHNYLTNFKDCHTCKISKIICREDCLYANKSLELSYFFVALVFILSFTMFAYSFRFSNMEIMRRFTTSYSTINMILYLILATFFVSLIYIVNFK